MKPFNLERALAGDPVITRDGRKVLKVLDGRHPKVNQYYQIFALIEGDLVYTTYSVSGAYRQGSEERQDLFMAPKKREGWVNVNKGRQCDPCIGRGRIYQTPEAAFANRDNETIGSVRIEWEE